MGQHCGRRKERIRRRPRGSRPESSEIKSARARRAVCEWAAAAEGQSHPGIGHPELPGAGGDDHCRYSSGLDAGAQIVVSMRLVSGVELNVAEKFALKTAPPLGLGVVSRGM